MQPQHYSITQARSKQDFDDIRALFKVYAATLPVDLAYQDFTTELAGLPGKYAPATGGELLMARVQDGALLGCVAMRKLPQKGCCEMKRLYVTTEGLGIGRALTAGIIEAARKLGYSNMLLDSLPTMHRAMALYRQLGFSPVEPYYDTPVEGTQFFGLKLAA